jgi:hypothetical protein
VSSQLTLENSLVQSIASSDLKDVMPDLVELGIDSVLKDGIFKEVPVISTLLGLYSAGRGIRDYLFIKKVIRFLMELDRIPYLERLKFIEEINGASKQTQLGETLLLLLERLDDFGKSEILACFFSCHIRGEIDFTMFRKLSTALEKLPIDYITSLHDFYSSTDVKQIHQDSTSLLIAGLVDILFIPLPFGDTRGQYYKNELGRIFLEKYQAKPTEM